MNIRQTIQPAIKIQIISAALLIPSTLAHECKDALTFMGVSLLRPANAGVLQSDTFIASNQARAGPLFYQAFLLPFAQIPEHSDRIPERSQAYCNYRQ